MTPVLLSNFDKGQGEKKLNKGLPFPIKKELTTLGIRENFGRIVSTKIIEF